MIKAYASYLGGLFLAFGCCLSASAQQQTPAKPGSAFSSLYVAAPNSAALSLIDPPPVIKPAPALIIRNFISSEIRFREAVTQFSFKRDVVLQTIGKHGEVTGEYIRNSAFVLDDRGERFEQVLFHPKPSITAMKITKEDIQDLAGSQLFGLSAADLLAYQLTYAGEDKVAGEPAYLVQVSPALEPDPNNMRTRSFVGLIWISQASFQIVQMRGTTEPHGKQRFPVFQTIRD
jgi:hypothetical protein